MDNSNSLFERLKYLFYKNMKYIIISSIIILIISIYLINNRSYIESKKIKAVEDKFIKTLPYQMDFCHEDIRNTKLCDYFVQSSSKSYLIGMQRYSHTSIEMIEKLLFFGCRYIELDIFSKDLKNDTVPIVSNGLDKGEWILSQNFIYLEDCFKAINDIAFSEKHVQNFKDPLFVFLNIKTTNKGTLDKVYDIIIDSNSRYLLSNSYKYQKGNIAQTTMCKLMGKLVIMSSNGYQDSKLEELINCSTNSNQLQRIYYSKLQSEMDKSQFKKDNEPDFFIISKFIEFKKGTQTDYIQINDANINFLEYKIDKSYIFKIAGAVNPRNNTPERFIKVKAVTKNKIYFSKDEKFTVEPEGNDIALRGYTQKGDLSDIVEKNKFTLTIVVPDEGIISKNFDPFGALTQGCQFVAIFHHTFDKYLDAYKKFFSKTSFKLKPSNLRKIVKKPIQRGIDKLFPAPEAESSIGIIYDFRNNYREIMLSPFDNSSIYWANNNGVARIKPKGLKTENTLVITEGLDGKPFSISFKMGDKYLKSNDNCCYLFYASRPSNNNEVKRLQFDRDSSFYPIAPSCGNEDYISIVISKSENYKKMRGEQYDGADYKRLHYIRYRKSFNPKTKLYFTKTTLYRKKYTFSSDGGVITVWSPQPKNGYYSYGDIAVEGIQMPKFSSKILRGAVSKPIDYELIYDNKTIDEPGKVSIWKPIPSDGYIAVGYKVRLDYNKPSVNDMICVASEYLDIVNPGDLIWKTDDSEKFSNASSSLSFWKVPSEKYFIATNSIFKPNEFDNPGFTINLEEKIYDDRLYLQPIDSDPGQLESACFKVSKVDQVNFEEKNLRSIKKSKNINNNKVVSFVGDDGGGRNCISLNNPFWSKYYYEENKHNIDTRQTKPIKVNKCREYDYIGTNFSHFGDNTIRFTNNTNYCISPDTKTCKYKQGIINTCDNFVISKCKNNRKNQQFYIDSDTNQIKFMNDIMNVPTNNCLTFKENNQIGLYKCDNKYKRQKWILRKSDQKFCVSVGSQVYILHKIPRGDSDWRKEQEPIDIDENITEEYDTNYFHGYIRGEIIEDLDDKWKIKLYNNLGEKITNKNSINMVADSTPTSKLLKPGTAIICRDGELTMNNYEEDIIKWKGFIIEQTAPNKFKIMMSINSLELNNTRDSMGRDRNMKEVIRDIYEIMVIKSVPTCQKK